MSDQINKPDVPVRTESVDPVDFLAECYQIFQRVSHKTGGTLEKFYNLHGHLIRLSFAGPGLTRITPALEHWAVEPNGQPELTIHLWDDASTDTEMPPPPWLGYGVYGPNGAMKGIYGRRGEVRGLYVSDDYCLVSTDPGRLQTRTPTG